MKNLSRSTPLPGRMLERRGNREIEASGDRVGKRYVIQINVINNFSSLNGTLLLLLRADEVPMRTLFTQTKGDLPSPAIEKTRIVRAGTFTACALHANHGRALTCGNSTLGPSVWAGPKKAGQDQQRGHENLPVRRFE